MLSVHIIVLMDETTITLQLPFTHDLNTKLSKYANHMNVILLLNGQGHINLEADRKM